MRLLSEVDLWEKSTVRYIASNRHKINRWLQRSLSRKSNRAIVVEYDYIIDELYSKLLEYFLDREDFDPDIGTFEGYIISGIGYIVERHYSELSKSFEKMVSMDKQIENSEKDTRETFGDTLWKQETLVDEEYRDNIKDIDSMCKCMEYRRYVYGVDLFLVSYIGAKIVEVEEKQAEWYLDRLGISKESIQTAYKRLKRDEQYIQFIKLLSKDRRAVGVIRKYVYGAKLIDKILKLKHELIRQDI